jgi:uncharacterized membrane protein
MKRYLERILVLDLMRSVGIFLMIIFHFTYDLNYFGLTDVDLFENKFWWGLPRFIASIFLFSTGLSFYYAYPLKNYPNLKAVLTSPKYHKRLLKLFLGALTITGVTYLIFPRNWVYFGILHCMFVVSLVLIPCLRFPKVALILGLLITGLGQNQTQEYLNFSFSDWNQKLFLYLGLEFPQHVAVDLISPFPWVGVAFLGLFIGQSSLIDKINLPLSSLFQYLALPGRHSLVIYLLHQPILILLIYLFTLINR